MGILIQGNKEGILIHGHLNSDEFGWPCLILGTKEGILILGTKERISMTMAIYLDLITHQSMHLYHSTSVPSQDLDSLIHHLKVKDYYNNELLIVYHLHTYDYKHQTHSNLPNCHLLNEKVISQFIFSFKRGL